MTTKAGKHGGERKMVEEAELLAEYKYYLSRKPELLVLFEGRFALIKGRELIGIFDTHRAAYLEGRKRLGNVPMLIHRIEREEEVVWLPGFQVGFSDESPQGHRLRRPGLSTSSALPDFCPG